MYFSSAFRFIHILSDLLHLHDAADDYLAQQVFGGALLLLRLYPRGCRMSSALSQPISQLAKSATQSTSSVAADTTQRCGRAACNLAVACIFKTLSSQYKGLES